MIRVTKEKVEEKVARAVSERDEAIKALEDERADQKVKEESIREKVKQEVVRDIVKFGMTFKCLALFMIREKYPDLDFFNINFIDMMGYDIFDLDERGSAQTKGVGRIQELVQGEGTQA